MKFGTYVMHIKSQFILVIWNVLIKNTNMTAGRISEVEGKAAPHNKGP
jgi:hypothetical protein